MAANGLMKTLGLAGAALAAWYFLDPKKGAERREKVAQGARETYDNLGREVTRIGQDLASGVSDTVTRISEMTGLSGSDGSSDGGKSASSSAHSTNSAHATQRV